MRQHYVGLNIHSFDETHFMVTFVTYRQQSPAHSYFSTTPALADKVTILAKSLQMTTYFPVVLFGIISSKACPLGTDQYLIFKVR